MPALSPTMEAGKIAQWNKKEGDKIELGDSIADIETDKATLSFDSTDEGILAKILVKPGESISVKTPIGILGKDASDVEKYKNFTSDMLTEEGGKDEEEEDQEAEAPKETQTTTKEKPKESRPETDKPEAKSGEQSRVIASPLARKLAAEKKIPLQEISGTGPGGRIIKADIEEFQPKRVEPTKVGEEPVKAREEVKARPKEAALATYADTPNTNIRQITANRLTSSKQNIPHYYLSMEINVDNLLNLRTQLNEMGNKQYHLSINDFVIKAAALALKAVPQVNSEWRGDTIRTYKTVHINVAVNTPRGLLTPLIQDVDKIGLKAVSQGVKEAAARANEGKSTGQDLQSGSFTISNLGMFGISHFTAIINPPQAAILAVGTTRKVVQLVEQKSNEIGEAKPQHTFKNVNMLTVTLSCDHRVVDGAVGAQWLQVFKDLLENPIKFLV